jgi:hypothetical protein
MPWFKVDDGLHKSRKRMRLGRKMEGWAALGLWAHLGSWSSDELTEGFISDEDLEYHEPHLGQQLAKRLERVGLFERVTRYGVDGWLFHDWDEYQPSKEEVLADRAANAARQKRFREKAKAAREAAAQAASAPKGDGVSNGDRNGVTNALATPSVTVPPTRPDPYQLKTSSGEGPYVANGRNAREPEPPNNEPAGPAEKILTDWIGTLARRPQQTIVDQIGGHVANALRDGCDPGDVADALKVWQARNNLGPSVLPSLIHEHSNPQPPGSEVVPFRGRAVVRGSTSDDRFRQAIAAGEAVAAQLTAEGANS